MAMDDTGFTYGRSMAGIFKIVTIICSLCAFICAIVLGASWQIEIVAFFNITQLLILIYAIAVLIMRVTNILKINWWKLDVIMSMILACLEFAAATTFVTLFSAGSDSLAAMVVFGYITGIVCLANAAYMTLKI